MTHTGLSTPDTIAGSEVWTSPLPSPPFGSRALELADQYETAAWASNVASYHDEKGDAALASQWAEGHRLALARELHSVRAAIASVPPGYERLLDEYILGSLHPDRFVSRSHSVGLWLAEKATDSQLLGFLRWHNQEVESQGQSAEFVTVVDREKSRYSYEVQQAVDAGHFSDFALSRLDDTENTTVHVGDLWDTVFKDAYAYHWYDSNYAIVRQGDHRHPANRIIGLTQLVREFLPHELDHVAFGVWQERWFNEAMAQHVTLSFEDGRFEALSPEDRGRSRGNRVYVPERELLALVMYGGGEHIDASVATRAHTSSGPNSPEWQEFMARLDASWGTENFYNRLARSIAVTEEAYQAAYPQFSRAQIQTYAIQVVTSQLREELRAKSDQKKTKGSLMRVVGRLLRPNSSA